MSSPARRLSNRPQSSCLDARFDALIDFVADKSVVGRPVRSPIGADGGGQPTTNDNPNPMSSDRCFSGFEDAYWSTYGHLPDRP